MLSKGALSSARNVCLACWYRVKAVKHIVDILCRLVAISFLFPDNFTASKNHGWFTFSRPLNTGWLLKPFDAHCCHMGTARKHPVPDRVKPSFVIFDIWAL